ncbi:hypothetical protein GCM10010520_17090 [Rhizobium viscosum]
MAADIHHYLIARKPALAAIIQADFDGLRPDKPSLPHDEFGTARLIGTKVKRNLPIDHRLLAPPNGRHIDTHRSGRSPKFGRVLNQMSDPCTPDLVFARQTGDRRAGAANPSSLDDRDFLAGTSQVPSEQFTALAAAKDQGVEVLNIRHGTLRELAAAGRFECDLLLL